MNQTKIDQVIAFANSDEAARLRLVLLRSARMSAEQIERNRGVDPAADRSLARSLKALASHLDDLQALTKQVAQQQAPYAHA